MSNIDTGGPAFPNPALADENFRPQFDMSGMTLRDYYAGQALAGFCANPSVFAANGMNGWDLVNCTDEQLAAACVRLATAMLKAREPQA